MRPLPRTRLLAIDPTRQGFAYVLLESEILIDWGTKDAGGAVDAALRRLAELLTRFKPTHLLIEEHMPPSRRSPRAWGFLVNAELAGHTHGVEIVRVSRLRVMETFPDCRTKHDIALSLADSYPELRAWRPRRRKPWMSEDERMNIFDALALAETFSTDSY